MGDEHYRTEQESRAEQETDQPQPRYFSLQEVARHLDISPENLQRLRQRFARYLGAGASATEPAFTSADIAALVTVQKLLAQGHDDEQIHEVLTPLQVETEDPSPLTTDLSLSNGSEDDANLPQVVGDVLHTIVNNQQAVLNGQSNLRDMLNVVVQDNFNLKDENRKLRERMLELERTLAEYQRREETRKERMESRVRALESTVAALQQQVAQLIQIQRQQQRRRGWFR